MERHLARTSAGCAESHELHRWLEGPSIQTRAALLQKRFTLLRLRFNAVLLPRRHLQRGHHQRSESETALARRARVVCREALSVPGVVDPPPSFVTWHAARRGHSRARTRLPGGGENPMCHRAGAARADDQQQLGLFVDPRGRASVRPYSTSSFDEGALGPPPPSWLAPGRCRALDFRIVADFWSIAKVGITSTSGLLGA